MLRFAVPDSLLALLRKRRERQQAERTSSQSSRLAPRALLEDLSKLSDGADLGAMAREYVDGMNGLQEQVERDYDAYLLDPGMGPMRYLAADGRIIVDERTWDGEDITFETSLDMAIVALVVRAQNTGLSELFAITRRLEAGSICPMCRGSRFSSLPSGTVDDSFCFMCFGRGEVDERMLAQAKERGLWQ